MSGKNKVTLYIPPDLHRKLKVKAAVESEPMSAIAERAIIFYLTNSHIVDEVESSQGNAHRVYSCPECDADFTMKSGEIVQFHEQPSIIQDDELGICSEMEKVVVSVGNELHDQANLVPC